MASTLGEDTPDTLPLDTYPWYPTPSYAILLGMPYPPKGHDTRDTIPPSEGT